MGGTSAERFQAQRTCACEYIQDRGVGQGWRLKLTMRQNVEDRLTHPIRGGTQHATWRRAQPHAALITGDYSQGPALPEFPASR